MDSSEQRRDEIFERALALPSSKARADYLAEACGDNPALRQQLQELLEAHEQMGAFLERGGDPLADHVHQALGTTSDAEPAPAAAGNDEHAGDVIGRYKLLQRVGEGGFGIVYMAEQLEPMRRRVALKVIKSGMDTKNVVARFEAERQALALMEHPNIARALDAGATDAGRPYFVMELVRGVPITRYCDEAKLDLRERLGLFVKVCDAVQHAHQKGIIHRDLKPGNVLVTLHDGVPVPKVIDFGIAKAMEQRLTEKTLFTEFRQMIGTPEYMAPEQAEMSGLDVDTRADVYSLGVLLYELLTGKQPFDMRHLLRKGFDEAIRTLREDDPPKPSTRVSTLGDELPTIARHRHAAPQALGSLIRGDLDWIAMKSLEKDRLRRYQTARELAQDVTRYLRNDPVLATPPSFLYRLRKYARRHRVGVATTVTVVLALAAGLTAAATGFLEARREADRANLVQRLVLDLLVAPDPDQFRGPGFTVRELIDEFEWRMRDEIESEPEVEATILTTLGGTLASLGLLERANTQLDHALASAHRAWSRDHDVIADALRYKGVVVDGLGEFEEAVTFFRRGIAMRRRLHGNRHPELAKDLCAFGHTLKMATRLDQAEAALKEARDIQRHLYGESHADLADTITSLGMVYEFQGHLAKALRQYELAREIYDVELGRGRPRAGTALSYVARIHKQRGDLELSETLAREAVQRLQLALGDAPRTAWAMGQLALTLNQRRKSDDAVHFARRSLEVHLATHGPDSPHTGESMGILSQCLIFKGELDEGEKYAVEAERVLRPRGGREYAFNQLHFASAAWFRNDFARAQEKLEAALATLAEHYGSEHIEVANAKASLATVLLVTGKHVQAAALLREVLPIQIAQLGEDSNTVTSNLTNLGQALRGSDELEEARAVTRKALDLARRHHPDHMTRASAAGNLATLLGSDRLDEKIQLIIEALDCLERIENPPQAFRQKVRANLAMAYAEAQRWTEAGEEFTRVLPMSETLGLTESNVTPAGRRALLGYLAQAAIAFSATSRWSELEVVAEELMLHTAPGDTEVRDTHLFYGAALENQGKHAEAEEHLRKVLTAEPQDWQDHWARALLGSSLAGQGRHAEAEPLLLDSYESLQPPAHLRHQKKRASECIVGLYEAWGKEEEARRWRSKLK